MDYHDDENVDLAEIEANLYAKIHHDAPETVEQYTAAALLQQSQPQQLQTSRVVTKKTVVNKAGTQAPNSQNGRYWGDGKHQPRAKVSSKKGRLNPFSVANQLAQQPNASLPQPTVPADYRPKPFTPYTSILSIGSVGNSTPNNEAVTDEIPKRISQSKKQRKNMLNPFNRFNENKLKRNEKFNVKKERATNAKAKERSKTIDTINLDTSEEDEDDDVICIPVPPPPLVCIDSTEDEEENDEAVLKQQANYDDNAVIPEDFIGQRDRSRMSQSMEDDALGGINDDELSYICDTVESAIRWHESETFVTANNDTPNEMTDICSPVPANSSAEPERNSTICEDDSVVFATPQKTAVAITGKQTYEVSEHGFAAVDVYESESSDFPESVYGKGASRAAPEIRPINASDSDISDIEINTHNRSKRMMKRKTSTSNKGSDYKTDDGDESDDGVPFLDILKETSTPYLQRGEAVINAKVDKHKQKVVTHRKSAPSVQSDDEFLSMLSCIVHDDADKDVLNSTDDDPRSNKTNEESSSIDARQVVEHVLRKMSKSAVPQDNEVEKWVVTDEVSVSDVEDANKAKTTVSDLAVEAEAVIKEGKSPLSWIVKDQIGETDNFIEDIVPTIKESLTSADVATNKADNVSIITAGPRDPTESDKTDKQCVRSCSLVVDPEIGWNDEMKRFYNDSWGGESFSTHAIQKNMPHRRAYEWHVLPDDNYVQRRNNRNRNLRCINCREEGHRMQDCYMPPKQIKCHMCGQTGHREPRCPQKMCLRCGSQNNVFSRGCKRCHYMQGLVCPICKTRGHGTRECPDKWRRYHSTINPGQPLEKLPMLINKPKYCCICAGKGHTAEYCRNALRILDTPMPPIHINSYNNVYDPIKHENSKDEQEDSPRFVLMSAPLENLQFSWDVDESPNRFYGRVMTSTNIIRQPFIEPRKKRLNKKNSVQMVINPMSTINQDLNKMKKQICKSADMSSLPNIDTRNVAEATLALADKEVHRDNDQPIKHKLSARNCKQTNSDVKSNATSYAKQAETSLKSVEVPSDPVIAKPETTVEYTVQHEINHHQEQSAVNDQLSNRKQTKDPEQLKKQVNGDRIDFSFTKALNECRDHMPNKFNLNNIFGKYSISGDVSTPLFNASNDWINSNFLNVSTEKVSEHSFNTDTSQADQQTMDTTLDIGETTTPFNQRHSTPNKDLDAKRISTKENSLRNTDVDRISVPQAPSPPSMFCESDKIAAEVRRLDHAQKFLENLKQEFSTSRTSNNDDPDAFVVSLNEDVEEATKNAKRIRLDSDSNYSFSEYFEGDRHSDDSDSHKDSTSIDDAGSSLDFIPLDNGSEDIDDMSTGIRHMVKEDPLPSIPVERSTVYLSKDHCKCLLTRSGNDFLTNSNSKHNVVVRMEWRSFGNILTVEGSTSSQDQFHSDLIAYCEAAEKAAHAKRLTSQKLPRNRLSLIKFIKDQIMQLEKSHGNVKELYLRMCMHQKQNNKNHNRNADRLRRLLNMILMGQTGLRDGPLHLKLLQSNLKSLLLMKNLEVSNQIREEVFKHYQYIFSPVEHSDYPGLLSEYEAIRKKKQRPAIKLDRSLLGLKIDVTFPAKEDAASTSHDMTNVCDEKKPLLSMNKVVEGNHINAPPSLLEAVKRMKKNNCIKSETNLSDL